MDRQVERIRCYLLEHQGKFPNSPTDISKRRRSTPSQYRVYYGFDPNTIIIREGCLINTETNEQVFLLDGPRSVLTRKWKMALDAMYEKASLELYAEMWRIRFENRNFSHKQMQDQNDIKEN